MLHYRQPTHEDFAQIAAFPRNSEEAFYMFPRGQYPLTAEQLEAAAAERLSTTLIMNQDEIVGYGNLYNVHSGSDCWIGNIMVEPSSRRTGAGRFLLRTLVSRAVEEHKVKEVHLVCHNTNTHALLFYTKLGFKPYDTKILMDQNQNSIVGIMMSVDPVALLISQY